MSTPDDLPALGGLALDAGAAPVPALHVVDLDVPCTDPEAAAAAAGRWPGVLIGVSSGAGRAVPDALASALTCTFVPRRAVPVPVTSVAVDDPHEAAAGVADAVSLSPRAAMVLLSVLGATRRVAIEPGLVVESLAYSVLLGGPEFARWRARRPPRTVPVDAEPVRLRREGSVLRVRLDRPRRRNAYDRAMRDGLVDAFDLAVADPSVTRVELSGAGPAFCSGGDLDEFGSAPDGSTAHLVRLDRSVAARVARCRDRVHVTVHGACIGAGIEIPSFAGRVVARRDAWFQLPEIGMGLIPGAGGTVGITRRIGPWRTAYLALSGARLDAATAMAWGLIDGWADDGDGADDDRADVDDR